MVLVFRQRGGPAAVAIRPRALEPGVVYRLRRFPAGTGGETTARENGRDWRVSLPSPYTAVLIEYTKEEG